MFFHFNFQTQANFDDSEHCEFQGEKSINLPTTSHNSPGSMKSGCSFELDLQNSPDNSFEEGTQVNHAQSIWNASVAFLNNTVDVEVDHQSGFNNDHLYRYSSFCDEEQKSLDAAIKGNRLLRCKDRIKFIQDLQKQTEVCGLLVQLMVLFNEKVFNELIYVIQNIWQRNYLKYRQNKVKTEPLIPKFKCFFGFNDEEKDIDSVSMFDETNASEIKQAAQMNLEQLVSQLFNSKKLKYLNLNQVHVEKQEKYVIREQFTSFVKAISKSVFLSAEGIFEEQFVIPSFSQQDQEETDYFTVEKSNKFVRTFSQIYQDDQQNCFTPTISKHRKLD